jgi:hypothetical protein
MVTDIALFFEPISTDLSVFRNEGTVGEKIQSFQSEADFPEIGKGSVAIFGVSENRRSNSTKVESESLNVIRQAFYRLKNHFGNQDIETKKQ